MSTNQLSFVLNELPKRRGQFQELAKRADVSYSWISKLACGHINDPSSRRIDRLALVLKDTAK